MQYSAAAIIALAASTVSAGAYTNGTVYTTAVYTAYTTVCPAATQLTFNGVTYTVSSSTTLTITNCPCTVTRPVVTSSVVAPASSVVAGAPPASSPVGAPAAVYTNGTVAATTTAAAGGVAAPTGTAKASTPASPSTITASSGNKAFALSGASLAGVLGLAAYFL